MSDQNTDDQYGFGPARSAFLTNEHFVKASGSPVLGGLAASLQSTRRPISFSEPERPTSRDQTSGFMATGSGDLPLAGPPSTIEFRVIREGAPARRLRLSGNRYTFGSGEGCSIRLADPILRPMHAVLIRDAHQILVRAYSVPIQVNGNRTTEARLHVGDLLQLGVYQLELMQWAENPQPPLASSGEGNNDWDEAPNKLRFADAPTLGSGRGVQQLARGAAQRADALAAEESVWREQLRREVQQWRMAKAECDRRESRIDDRESDMRERETELWSRSETLRRREAELKAQESAVLEIQQEFEVKKQALAKLRAEDRARQEEFQRREAEFRQLEAHYREQSEQASEQLVRSQEQASVANEAIQRMREQFLALNGQLAELTNKQARLSEQDRDRAHQLSQAQAEVQKERDEALSKCHEAILQRDELAGQRDELVAQRDELAGQRDELVVQRGELSGQRDELVAQRDEAFAQREQAIKTRDESIGQRDAAQRARDRAINAQAQSDARRIELTEELNRAAKRLGEVEADLAASRREAQDSQQQTTALQRQVQELHETVTTARKETELLRSDYEAACLSITRLEGLLSEQTKHGNESKESWAIEAEHLRKSFESVSRDLAVALGELSELRETNATFSTQLEAVRAEKARVDAELQSRPTQDAWQELQNELNLASESLQIIQRDYNATLTELESLRSELEQEREFAANREVIDSGKQGDSAQGLAALNLIVPTAATTPPASDAQWANEDDAWPMYEAAPVAESPTHVPAVDSSVDAKTDAESQMDSPHEIDPEPDYERPAGDVDPVHLNIDFEVEMDRVDDVDSLPTPSTDGDENMSLSQWQSPIEPTDPSSVVESSEEVSYSSDVDPADPWAWNRPGLDEASVPVPDARNELEQVDSDPFDLGAVEPSPCELASCEQDHWSEPVESEPALDDDADAAPEFGSLASQLIADLDREHRSGDNNELDHDELTRDDRGGDEDDEPFFEATAVGFAVDGQQPELDGRGRWEAADDIESPLPWRVEPENNDADWEPTMLRNVGENSDPVHQSTDASDVSDDHVEADEAELTSSALWNNTNDSVVMDSELVASNDDSLHVAGRRLDAQRDTVIETSIPVADTPPGSDEADDDSIEAYMNRLLQRVQGSPATPSSKSSTETVTNTVATAATRSGSRLTSSLEPQDSQSLSSTEIHSEIDSDAPMMPRLQAPEKQGSLSAMRQLANESARTAINRSVKIQSRDTQLKAFTKFASAVGLVLCALAVATFTHFTGKLIIAGCMCVIAFVWVNEAFKLLGASRRRFTSADAGKRENEGAEQSIENEAS